MTGNTTMPAEVWIDGRQRVRREHIVYTITKPARVATDITIDLSDYGKPVSVETPADSITLDALKARGG